MELFSESDYLTVAQVAYQLNVSPATVRRMFDVGLLRGFRSPGRHRRIFIGSLNEYMRSGDQPKAATPGRGRIQRE